VIGRDAPDQEQIVVLRGLGLGDLVTVAPPLRTLRSAYPRARLVLFAPAVYSDLAALAGVDETVDHSGLDPLPWDGPRPSLAVNLHGRGPESSRLLAELAPERLIAFRHSRVPVTAAGPPWRPREHEVARWCRLLHHHGLAADPRALRLDSPGVSSPLPPGAVVVHPGAATTGRRWPAERFAATVRRIEEDGHVVALVGADSERRLCEDVARAAGGPTIVLAGRTTVAELAAVVSEAAAVVCNDSGVAHLASAYGTPSVVLFGPTSPSEWGPPSDGPHIALWKGLRGDPRAAELHPGLEQITVAEVTAAVRSLLDGTAPGRRRRRDLTSTLPTRSEGSDP